MPRAAALLSIALAAGCGGSSPPPPTRAERTQLVERTRGELTLEVRVTGLRSSSGSLLLSLFASERGFPADAAHAARTAKVELESGQALFRFERLAPATYAVAALHDENDSGSLDTGFLGIPSEGLGASNGAQGRFSPADWSDAKLELDRDRKIQIEMRYFP